MPIPVNPKPVKYSNNVQSIGSFWNGGDSFSLDSTSNLNVVLNVFSVDENANENVDLRLYQDTNNDLKFDPNVDLLIGSSTRDGYSNESINLESVAPGNYIIEAYMVSGDNANLTLSPSTEVENVGILKDTQTFTGFVGRTSTGYIDTNDLYKFSLADTSNLNVALTGMDAGRNANMRLYQDVNSNGVIDTPDQLIDNSGFDGNHDEEITRASLAAGDYIVEVYQVSGRTVYDISLSTANPSDLLPHEYEVDTLTGTRTFKQSVGNDDPSDVYHFKVGSAGGNFSLTLTDLTANADVRLIRDTDSNGIVDVNEVLYSSTFGSTTSESINASLIEGDYFVQVYQNTGNTNFTLNLGLTV